GAGNLISGNTGSGIRLTGTAGANNQSQGNVIGLSAAGTALGSANGVFVNGGPGTLIGGTNSQARNVISGSTTGISLCTSGTNYGVVIQGNYVGTDVSGTLARGNSTGVAVGSAPGTVVG